MPDGFKVLLIEDDADVRFAAVQALRLAGIEVEDFSRAEAALSRLHPSFPGIVVSDVRLPGMDGLEFLRRAIAIDPNLPIMLVTGHGDVAMAVEAMRAGAYDFIEKPVSSDHLVSATNRAIEKRRMTFEIDELRRKLGQKREIDQILTGGSDVMNRIRQTILSLADASPDILLLGETGSGKDVVARCLHASSRRASNHFVALNCGAIPESIFESELFGHEQGAFTGAHKRRIGKMEYASGGTLFLDEIEAMPMALQVKLLRAVQERKVERLGSNAPVQLDLRIVAATKVDLAAACARKEFRSDLFYRLNVVTIEIPPLRNRREDIPLLFGHFNAEAAQRYNRPVRPVTYRMSRELMSHSWPGNVRELRNAAERFVLGIMDEHLLEAPVEGHDRSLSDLVAEFERGLILDAMRCHQGRVAKVSEVLGIARKTLYEKISRYGIPLSAGPS